MKNSTRRICALLSAVMLAFAMMSFVSADEDKAYLIDDAGLFSDTQAQELEGMLDDAVEASGIDIVIVTAVTTDDNSASDYLESAYKAGGYSVDFAMLLIVYDAEYDEGEWYILYDGYAAEAITEYEFDNLSDLMYDDLWWNESFYMAAEDFIESVELAVVDARDGNTHGFLYYHKWLVRVLCAVAAALIVVIVAVVIHTVNSKRGRGSRSANARADARADARTNSDGWS
ncbi:MAG: TPM domain-containing protein [Firmicutes bacterium]|nr:TPM domain-containing protein [Bacillota bacterium]